MVRTVIKADNNTLLVPIPESYIGKDVEVIAFTLDESKQATEDKKKKVSFDAMKLDTTGYKFNREDANKR